MTDQLNERIIRRCYKDYVDRARQGSGLWARLDRITSKAIPPVIGLGTLAVGAALVASMGAAPLVSTGFLLGLSGAFTTMSATAIGGYVVANSKIKRAAHQQLCRDMNNGYVLDGQKNKIALGGMQNVISVYPSSDRRDQPASRDGFQNAASKRAENAEEMTTSQDAVAPKPKNKNSL